MFKPPENFSSSVPGVGIARLLLVLISICRTLILMPLCGYAYGFNACEGINLRIYEIDDYYTGHKFFPKVM